MKLGSRVHGSCLFVSYGLCVVARGGWCCRLKALRWEHDTTSAADTVTATAGSWCSVLQPALDVHVAGDDVVTARACASIS